MNNKQRLELLAQLASSKPFVVEEMKHVVGPLEGQEVRPIPEHGVMSQDELVQRYEFDPKYQPKEDRKMLLFAEEPKAQVRNLVSGKKIVGVYKIDKFTYVAPNPLDPKFPSWGDWSGYLQMHGNYWNVAKRKLSVVSGYQVSIRIVPGESGYDVITGRVKYWDGKVWLPAKFIVPEMGGMYAWVQAMRECLIPYLQNKYNRGLVSLRNQLVQGRIDDPKAKIVVSEKIDPYLRYEILR